jgi:hypothetical protein
MSFHSIQTQLEEHLAGVTNIPTIQHENERFVPVTGEPWVRFTLLPAATTTESIGVIGKSRMRGLAQIDCIYPENTPVVAINKMADAIIASFPKGMILTDSVVSIHIDQSWREVGYRATQTQFYQIPVMIRWSAATI